MRLKTVSKNAIYSLVLEIVMLIFGFIIPLVIINRFGSSVYGLTATVTRILKVMNLLQAGAIGAAIFSLYKPIVEKDYEKISYNLAVSKKFYIKTGKYYLLIAVLISPVFAWFTFDNSTSFLLVLGAFLILGINGSLSFFYLSYYDTVFSSHQQRYIISISRIIVKLIYYGLVFVVVYTKLPIIFLYLSILVATIVQMYYLHILYKKRFGNLIYKINVPHEEKIKKRESSMLYSISIQLVNSCPPIVLSLIYTYAITSVYSVYYLVASTILMLFHTIFYSIGESLGNLFYTKDTSYSNNIIGILGFLYNFLSMFLLIPVVFLTRMFINLYTDGVADINYDYPVLVLMIAVYLLFYILSLFTRNIINITGLYDKVSKASLVFSIIGIGLSVGLSIISMEFVLIGPIFYSVSQMIYEVIIIKLNHTDIHISNIPKRALISVLLIITTYILITNINLNVNGWINWIVYAFVSTFVALIIAIVVALTMDRKDFFQTIKYFKNRFIKKKN